MWLLKNFLNVILNFCITLSWTDKQKSIAVCEYTFSRAGLGELEFVGVRIFKFLYRAILKPISMSQKWAPEGKREWERRKGSSYSIVSSLEKYKGKILFSSSHPVLYVAEMSQARPWNQFFYIVGFMRIHQKTPLNFRWNWDDVFASAEWEVMLMFFLMLMCCEFDLEAHSEPR